MNEAHYPSKYSGTSYHDYTTAYDYDYDPTMSKLRWIRHYMDSDGRIWVNGQEVQEAERSQESLQESLQGFPFPEGYCG